MKTTSIFDDLSSIKWTTSSWTPVPSGVLGLSGRKNKSAVKLNMDFNNPSDVPEHIFELEKMGIVKITIKGK